MFRNWKRTWITLTKLLAMVLVSISIALAGKPDKPPKDPPPEPVPLPAYSYTSLGTLGGSFSVAEGMNELGDVVGHSRTAENRQRAFLWTESEGMVELIAPQPDWEPGSYLQSALDVNDDGYIVGGANLNGRGAAYLYSPNGSVVDITPMVVAGMEGDGDDTASAEAINNSRDVVGDFVTVPGNYNDAYLLLGDTGDVIPIGLLNGRRTHAKCISNRVNGIVQVAGVSVDEGGIVYHAFRFSYDTESGESFLKDLESAKSRATSSGAGINDLGDVTGYRSTRKGHNAFRYMDETGIEDLGTLGNTYSQARGINILGDVVGWSQTDDYWVDHGFLYTDQHGMLDLEEVVVDWIPDLLGNMHPECVNSAGQISGSIRIDNSTYGQAFLLTPISQ